MSKKHTFISGLLLIGASVIIYLLSDYSTSVLDMDLVGFFSGILFGAGIAIMAQLFIKKKNVA